MRGGDGQGKGPLAVCRPVMSSFGGQGLPGQGVVWWICKLAMPPSGRGSPAGGRGWLGQGAEVVLVSGCSGCSTVLVTELLFQKK